MFVRTVDPEKVALWDVDAAHPGGELYLAGSPDVTHEVADTPGVRAAIRQGKLIEVEAPVPAPGVAPVPDDQPPVTSDEVPPAPETEPDPDDQPPSDGTPPAETDVPVLLDTPVADAKPKKRGS